MRCFVRLIIILLPVVVVIPPLISLIISASSIVVVVPPILVRIVLPSLVIVATLIVPLIGAVMKVMSGCYSVVFWLELWTLIGIVTVICTDAAHSLWN